MYFLLISFLSSGVNATVGSEVKRCGDRLKKSLNGDPAVILSTSECPLSAKLHQWVRCQRSTASFDTIRQFLTAHPDWPQQEAMRRKAEEDLAKFPQPPPEMIRWFSKYPPLTGKGACVYARALKTQAEKLAKIAPTLLANANFSATDMGNFLQITQSLLSQKAIFRKANALLDKQEDLTLLPILMPYLTPPQQKTIQARQNPDQAMLLSAKSPTGIFLDQIRLNRKADKTDVAVTLLKQMAEIPPIQADSFWIEQNILARRLIEEKRYSDAYQIIQKHRLNEGENFANAEWLAGWLSLRFLNNPTQAVAHFKTLLSKVKSPISIARAQYWLGRSYQALKDKQAATLAFRSAAKHSATYYGQLAGKEIHGKILPIALKKPIVSPEFRHQFDSRPLVPLIRILLALKEVDRAEAFAISLGKQLKSPSEQALLIELMHEKGNKYLGVQVAKKSTITFSPLIPAAYPQLAEVHKGAVDPALAHAIIRQESRFKETAVSPAGAVGLMQLMAPTATQTIKKHKLKKGELTHGPTNISIGTRHLKDLLVRFNGSLILAAAAYNAGSSAVEKWLVTYGDPRDPAINATDWVELIPYAETRNYVQRVLENYYCYLQ